MYVYVYTVGASSWEHLTERQGLKVMYDMRSIYCSVFTQVNLVSQAMSSLVFFNKIKRNECQDPIAFQRCKKFLNKTNVFIDIIKNLE